MCKVLPGRTQEIKTWTAQLAETIPKEWNSRTVFTKDGKFFTNDEKFYVIPNASQILPFGEINCVMNFPGSLSQFPPRSRDLDSHTAYLIKKELSLIYRNPKPGIFVTTERNDTFYKIHALITGGFDSAYEGGLFHFQLYAICSNIPLHTIQVMLHPRGPLLLEPQYQSTEPSRLWWRAWMLEAVWPWPPRSERLQGLHFMISTTTIQKHERET